jgi:UDP-galactopyranose mutase
MKALILGGGFAGTTVAHLLHREGWETTLVEKEPHLGGGCRTFFHCGHPFQYGPRLYYGYSSRVWEWVNAIVPIRRFPFELKTLAHEPVDEDRKFWSFPPHELDIPHYPRSAQIQAELEARDNSKEPQDFDEYYRQKVGATLYEMFTDFYSRKMWSIESNKVLDTFRWSAKDKPIESGTREAYKGSFLGFPIPKDGYNGYFARMVEGTKVVLGATAWMRHNRVGDGVGGYGHVIEDADVIVSTIPIDELCGYSLGELPYAGRDFHLLVLPCKEVFPGDVRFCHYASHRDEWTRVTEFKKITMHESDSTLLVLEKPSKNGRLYPFLTKANIAKAEQYLKMLPENVYSIGRLGEYRYATIEQVIAKAFACVAKIIGKPSEEGCEGEFYAIGDKAMLTEDRKE